MALNLPPGYGQLTFVFDLDGDPQEMTTAIAYAAAGPAGSTALSERNQAWVTTIQTLLQSEYTYDRMIDRYNDGGTITEQEVIAQVPGAAAGSPLPSNCAVLVRKASAEVGRGKQGRMFIPGIVGEADVDHNGDYIGGAMAAIQTQVTNFYDELNVTVATEITDLVILHDETSPLAATPTIIGGLAVQNKIATQRRRMR